MKKIVLILLLFTGITNSSWSQCSQKVMEAFGGTSSIALYNTYVAIGAIADGFVAETYTSERVQTLMDEQTSMLTLVVDLLATAIADESKSLSQDDRDYLLEMKKCVVYLKNEAQGLHDIAVNGSDESNTAYNSNRELAWTAIEQLLGLNQE